MSSVTTDEAKVLMMRCQLGVHCDEVNNLHVKCYDIIGSLVQERDSLKRKLIVALQELGRPLTIAGENDENHA